MKEQYTQGEIIRLAKRYNNTKRTYLLVNPLQGKHVPVSPEKPLAMTDALGRRLVRVTQSADVIISFAETATAIGARVARFFPDSLYMQTTREKSDGECVYFSEEHSHSSAQKLCVDMAEKTGRVAVVIMIDDEVTTGATMRNLKRALCEKIPAFVGARFICASLIDRIGEADGELMRQCGFERVSLLTLPFEDYSAVVQAFDVAAPQAENTQAECNDWHICAVQPFPQNARLGVNAGEYNKRCEQFACAAAKEVLPLYGSTVVLGTEEYMYPAMLLARRLQTEGCKEVYFHATTRSPIGVLDREGYPARNGYMLASAYESGRATYIYNLKKYENAVLVSDGGQTDLLLRELGALLRDRGCVRRIFVRG